MTVETETNPEEQQSVYYPSRREFFIAHALSGLLSREVHIYSSDPYVSAIEHADFMLEAMDACGI